MELQGHRGARSVLPENSLAGFRYAIAAGADALELDIAMTADRQLVITHDPGLNPQITRLAGNWISEPLAIPSLTFEQLQAFDVGRFKPGSAYAEKFPNQVAIDGLTIPHLSELFGMAELAAHPKVVIDIEIKTFPDAPDLSFAPEIIGDALVELVEAAGLRHRVRVRSLDWRGLMHLKASAPDIALAFLTAEQPSLNTVRNGPTGPSPWLGGLDLRDFDGSAARAIASIGGEVWAPHFHDVREDDVRRATDAGLKVIVWTVNDALDMRRMIDLGVDGFTTDDPKLGRHVIDTHVSQA